MKMAQKDILPQRKKRKIPFFQRKDWTVSAVLVLVIYGVLLLAVYLHVDDPGTLYNTVHVLPLVAVLMFVLGYIEKRNRESEETERKAKRLQARTTLSRLEREARMAEKNSEGDNR